MTDSAIIWGPGLASLEDFGAFLDGLLVLPIDQHGAESNIKAVLLDRFSRPLHGSRSAEIDGLAEVLRPVRGVGFTGERSINISVCPDFQSSTDELCRAGILIDREKGDIREVPGIPAFWWRAINDVDCR
jgi:hypothetical protein